MEGLIHGGAYFQNFMVIWTLSVVPSVSVYIKMV